MKEQHKNWLIKNKITSLDELVKKFEVMRQVIETIPRKERKIYCDLVYFLIYKESVLNSFFRENNKREVATHLSFKEAKNILLERASREGNILFLHDLVNAETFEALQKAVDNCDRKLQTLGTIDMSKGDIAGQLKTCFENYKTLTPHIKFTILEENVITEKQQEEISREHIGRSTRLKAGCKMTYLDEVIGDNEKKVFEQLEDKTDRAYICFERKEKIKKEFSIAGEKAGIKESQSVQKAPIFTYCKVNKNALEKLALRAAYGHDRYKDTDQDWQNFTRVPNGDFEYANAQFRHALDIGEEDEEKHLIASAWNAVARLEIFLREKQNN